jgi:His/Glu/Gln/Arg/opine family amino acid ABC transporter permease subunit
MDFSVIFDNWEFFLKGLSLSFLLAIVTGFLSFLIGIFLAIARLSRKSFIKYPAIIYIEFIRSIPLIMFIFWVYFLLPLIIKVPLSALSAVIIAFIGFNCTYFAEVLRAGIQSIPSGQTHAGICSGLSYYQVMRYIVLPQAIVIMVPPLINRFIALFMGTSLAYVIGVVEFFRAAVIINSREFKSIEIFAFVGIVYFICDYLMSLASKKLEKKWEY